MTYLKLTKLPATEEFYKDFVRISYENFSCCILEALP